MSREMLPSTSKLPPLAWIAVILFMLFSALAWGQEADVYGAINSGEFVVSARPTDGTLPSSSLQFVNTTYDEVLGCVNINEAVEGLFSLTVAFDDTRIFIVKATAWSGPDCTGQSGPATTNSFFLWIPGAPVMVSQ